MKTFLGVFTLAASVTLLLAVTSAAHAEPAAPNIQPAPGQAAASAASPDAVRITATCSLGDHSGIDAAEARTAADIVCHDLASRGATNTQHEIRFGRLGGRTLLTVASRSGNTYDERRTFLNNLDEVEVAGPRLAGALSDGRTLEETRNVDNVLGAESRPKKTQRGNIGVDASVFGVSTIGYATSPSAGAGLGVAYHASSIAIAAQGRGAGFGSGDERFAGASFDLGARWYMSDSDVSPFVGGGVGFGYFVVKRTGEARGTDFEGSGFGTHALLGVEMLRTHHIALTAAVRVDAPLFSVRGTVREPDARSTIASRPADVYLVPVALNVGLSFH